LIERIVLRYADHDVLHAVSREYGSYGRRIEAGRVDRARDRYVARAAVRRDLQSLKDLIGPFENIRPPALDFEDALREDLFLE